MMDVRSSSTAYCFIDTGTLKVLLLRRVSTADLAATVLFNSNITPSNHPRKSSSKPPADQDKPGGAAG